MTKNFAVAVLRPVGLRSLLALCLAGTTCFMSSHDATAQGSPHLGADLLDPPADAPPFPLGDLRLDGQDIAPQANGGHDDGQGQASELQLKFYGESVPFDSHTKEMLPRIDLTPPSVTPQPPAQ